MNADRGSNGWGLEVVRGRDTGRVYPIRGGEVVLGNSVGAGSGIDLAEQEGNSPRKMAAHQALLKASGRGVVLQDLDSPGGTFVNRQRLLPGQGRELQAGDVIQLGSVQLRLVETRPTTTPPSRTTPAPAAAPAAKPTPPLPRPASSPWKPAPAPAPTASNRSAPLAFTLKAGPTCRSWDDFLAISAQRWADLRDELTSGRLAAYLGSIGRADMAPAAHAPGSPDERLDAWIAGLPTVRPSKPELEVHPRSIALKASPGGGITRRSLRVSNVGYRLLRSQARVEPSGTAWMSIPPEYSGRSFLTVEGSDVPIEVRVPESYSGRLTAEVVIEGNGGTCRVPVTLEPPGALTDPFPGAIGEAAEPAGIGWDWRGVIARQSIRSRLLTWASAGLIFRASIAGSAWLLGPTGLAGPAALPGPAMAFGVFGAIAGASWAWRRGSVVDVPAGAFTGGFAGVLFAALGVALCQAIEPVLGATRSGSLIAVGLLWALIGAALAGLSAWIIPPRSRVEEP